MTAVCSVQVPEALRSQWAMLTGDAIDDPALLRAELERLAWSALGHAPPSGVLDQVADGCAGIIARARTTESADGSSLLLGQAFFAPEGSGGIPMAAPTVWLANFGPDHTLDSAAAAMTSESEQGVLAPVVDVLDTVMGECVRIKSVQTAGDAPADGPEADDVFIHLVHLWALRDGIFALMTAEFSSFVTEALLSPGLSDLAGALRVEFGDE